MGNPILWMNHLVSWLAKYNLQCATVLFVAATILIFIQNHKEKTETTYDEVFNRAGTVSTLPVGILLLLSNFYPGILKDLKDVSVAAAGVVVVIAALRGFIKPKEKLPK